ncbi:MAG TPA: type II toxin-antitoxin system HicA family toxin, partial [Methanolinea sp.]|nr:type II toxin-antitoxin system HicA family toxin [Methanolinea sp.]
FSVSGHSGSHVRLSRIEGGTKVGTVVPLHDDVKPGTLHGILKLARIDQEEFYRYL